MQAYEQLEKLILVGYNLNEISKHTTVNRTTLSKILKNKVDSNATVNFKINEFFNKNIENVELGKLANIDFRRAALINTPDGWQSMGGFVEKGKLPCKKVIFNNHETIAADEHLFQLSNNEWLYTKALKIGDIVLTEDGTDIVKDIQDLGEIECYDITVNHENHRYYLDGISSHNTGKSLLAALIMSNALKQGYDAIFYFDSEGGGSKEFFENVGCDTEKIYQILVSSIEDAQLKILDTYNTITEIKKENPEARFLCVLDSLGALVAEKVLRDADKGKVASEMGGRAKQCLSPETLVLMADNTYKEIQHIEVGDLVITGKNNIKPVLDVIKTVHEKYLTFSFSNGKTIDMSYNHRMLIFRNNNFEFIKAEDIMLSDFFVQLNKDNTFTNISIEKIEEKVEIKELYDIEVEDDHTFCITEDNIISHNCNNMMKALTIPALQTDTAMIVLNHVYDDPSAMYSQKIKQSGGGKGLQYMGSIILQCTRNLEKDEDKNSEAYYGGTNLKFFTVKNRMARPSLECDVYLDFKKGFTRQLSALFDEAVRGGFITCPSQGYYCVPSSADPEKKRRRSEIENDPELWKTFLKEFDEWSQKDLQYSKLETIDLDNEEVQEKLDMLIDQNENVE